MPRWLSTEMAAPAPAKLHYVYILLCLVLYLCRVTCELDLIDGSACVSEGLSGTCVSVFRCETAAWVYTYLNSGYDEEGMPTFPEICSYKDGIPVVCCTDCRILDNEDKYKHATIDIYNRLLIHREPPPKAYLKCEEYQQHLPNKCRFTYYDIVGIKILNETRNCHEFQWPNKPLPAGGRLAERWEYPHMALLGYGSEQQTAQWLCGGSIISEWFILTAAHCLVSPDLGRVTFAALGLLKRSDPLKYWKVYKIKRAIGHPDYKPPSKYHDIALLETDTEINLSRQILPACLGVDSSFTGSADASGWGELGRKNVLADTLQVVTLSKFTDEECALQYPPHRHMTRGYDPATQLCYGDYVEVVNTCPGDSGGPLQGEHNKCKYTVYGVTSIGNKYCSALGSAGIYTKVAHYVPWIETIVWPD